MHSRSGLFILKQELFEEIPREGETMQILIVEDEIRLAEALGQIMEEQGYQVDMVYDGEDGLNCALTGQYDVIVLDVMLPGKNGFQIVRLLRQAHIKTPVLLLTARDETVDKVTGLDCGADDYMTKPFSVSELLARVEALVRRVGRQGASSAAPEPDGRMVSGVFVLDQKSRVLYKNGTPIDLTQVEFQIMELFFANPGVALVREKILEGVWGENYFGDVKIVDVNIRRLRMKIEDEPSAPKHILTVWGYGYRWNA